MKNATILVKSLVVILVTIGSFSVSARADDQGKDYKNGFSAGPGVVVSDKPFIDVATHNFRDNFNLNSVF